MKPKLRRFVSWQLELRVKRLLKRSNVKIVAVTGSVGKTSTKLAIAAVLRQKYRVLAHPGNYNSEIGLPLSIFEEEVPSRLENPVPWALILRRIDRILSTSYPYDVIVLEMGADEPGDIKKFMRYIKPDIGVVTAISPAHMEQFGSLDAIADEKMALARGSRVVFLNAEDERVIREGDKLSEPYQTYGVKTGGVHFDNLKRASNITLTGKIILNDGEMAVATHMVGRHNLNALAAAAAVGEELGLENDEIRAGLESILPPSGRMQLLKGLNNSTIIDDTYNSSPRATIAALETLLELPGRKIAIMGSMNELGEMAVQAHREVGRACRGVDMLVTIGDLASKYILAGAIEAGMKKQVIHTFMSPYEAGRFVKTQLKAGDIVLAKGSQNGVFAEEAVALLLESSVGRSKLVRQSVLWQRIKKVQFPSL